MLDSVQDRKALGSLIFARIVYAVNWLNIGGIFYLMARDLSSGVSGLGVVTAVFYLGVGASQVPGGILSAKWGPKNVVVLGIFLSSFSTLAISVMTTIPEIAVLRLLVGIGMALVFAPGVAILTSLLQGVRAGLGVGLFNSAYNLGGVVAIFGWIVIAMGVGWRESIAVGGIFGVISGLLVLVFIPQDGVRAEFEIKKERLARILLNRQLVLLGVATLGFSVGNTIISGFMVFYLNNALSVTGTIAGLVTSLVLFVSIFAAIWGGRLYDSVSRHRLVLAVALVGSAAGLALAAFPSIYTAAACSAVGGVVTGIGYTFAFAGARDLHRAEKEYESLAIALVNSISLAGSFLPPILFSYLVERLGYSQAWLWTAAITLLFLIPIFLMAESWKRAN